MSKRVKVLLISAASLVVFLGILSIILFAPIRGEKREEIWSASDVFNPESVFTMEKEEGKPFKILQLTDLQLWMNISDNKVTYNMVKELISDNDPDLVVLTGDNVSGVSDSLLVKQLIKTLDECKVPWAPIFGNHDSEIKATKEWQGDKFIESEYGIFSHGPTNLMGVGNYIINIEEKGKVIQTLYMLDNGDYMKYVDETTKKLVKDEPYMGLNQIAWSKWNAEGIKKAESAPAYIPSMSFTHSALPEFYEATKDLEKNADGRYVMAAQTDKYSVEEGKGFGSLAYFPGVAPINTGFVDEMKSRGMHANFCGHDHENDASIVYEGFRHTYGLKVGPSPRPWNNASEYGGTLITIDGIEYDNDNQKYITKYAVEHIVHSKAADWR